jgi:hypothetical protein
LDTLRRREKEASASPLNKIAALDRLPQIEMTRFIWRNLYAIDEESTMRKGRYAIEKIAAAQENDQTDSVIQNTTPGVSSFTNMLENDIDGETEGGPTPGIEPWYRLEDIVGKWGKSLKQIADSLERRTLDMEPFEFISGLQTIVDENTEKHTTKLEELRRMNEKIQE